MRKEKEIQEYLDEAFDKVWLCRSHPSKDEFIEKHRMEKVDEILSKYDDIPKDDWDYGYCSGILASLRWVLGENKDFLDT